MRKFLCIASTQLVCWAAQASGLHIQVQDREGKPLPEAVVVLYPVGLAAPASPAPPAALAMSCRSRVAISSPSRAPPQLPFPASMRRAT